MNKIMRKIIPVYLIFAFTANVYAASGGAAFLKKGVGARALGMGGAFTSVSNDTSAVKSISRFRADSACAWISAVLWNCCVIWSDRSPSFVSVASNYIVECPE